MSDAGSRATPATEFGSLSAYRLTQNRRQADIPPACFVTQYRHVVRVGCDRRSYVHASDASITRARDLKARDASAPQGGRAPKSVGQGARGAEHLDAVFDEQALGWHGAHALEQRLEAGG